MITDSPKSKIGAETVFDIGLNPAETIREYLIGPLKKLLFSGSSDAFLLHRNFLIIINGSLSPAPGEVVAEA